MGDWRRRQRRLENAAAAGAAARRAQQPARDAERRAVEHVGVTVARRWVDVDRRGYVAAVGNFGSVSVQWSDGDVETLSSTALRVVDQ